MVARLISGCTLLDSDAHGISYTRIPDHAHMYYQNQYDVVELGFNCSKLAQRDLASLARNCRPQPCTIYILLPTKISLSVTFIIM